MASYSLDSNSFKNGLYVYTKKYINPTTSSSSSSGGLATQGGVIGGSVIISGTTNLQNDLVFPDASVQTRAVTNEMFDTLENLTNATSNISRSNNVTIVDGQFQSVGLNVSGNINFPAQSIGQEVIDGLPDLVTDYNAYKISNNTNITNLENTTTSQFDVVNTELLNITNNVSTNSTAINSLSTSILAKQNLITELNMLSSTLISTAEAETLEDKLIEISDALNTKQDIINDTDRQLPISFIQNLSSELTTIGSQISLLSGLQNGDVLSFQTIQDNFDTIEATKQPLISSLARLNANLIADGSVSNDAFQYLANVDSDIKAQFVSQTQLLNDIQADIIDVQNYNTQNDVTITEIHNDINSILNTNTIQDNSITNIQTSILNLTNNKQNNITISSKLPIENVNLGTSSLSFVDISSSLQGDLNAISNTIDSLNTGLNTNTTAISNLLSADILHQNAIDTNTSAITSLQSSKQNAINGSNLLPSNLIETGQDETLDSKLIAIGDDIALKQNIIDTDNKLPIASVNLTGSSLVHVDITSSLNTQLVSINNTLNTLTTLQAGDVTSFQTIQDNFDTIDGVLLTKQNIIDSSNRLDASNIGNGSVSNVIWSYLSNIDADIQTQINNLQTADNAIHSISYATGETTIAEKTILTTLKFSGDNSEQTTAFTTAKNTELSNATSNISTLQTDLSTAQSGIDNINSNLLLKQDVINTDNKLPIASVNLGSSALSYVDISSSLQTELTNISNALNALQDEDTSQSTFNNQITADITNLQTGKQNVINANNKINSLYVSYNSINVKDELDALENYHTTNDNLITDIQNDILSLQSTKQDVINSSNKLPIASVNLGTSALSFVDISSSLQTDLNTITSDIDALTTSLNTNTSSIANLVSADILHQNALNSNASDISNLQSSKQDVISISNLLESSLVETGVNETLDIKLSAIDASITNLETTKQDVIDTDNKLPISSVNLGSSALSYVDITAPLQAQLTNINDTISTLTTLQSGDASSFTSINNSISTINTTLAGKQDSLGSITSKFTYLSNVTSDIQTQIDNISGGGGAPSISYDAPSTTTTISDTTLLTTLKFSGDNSIQTTAFTTDKNTALSNATSNISTLQSDMTTAQADIALKQNIIDNSNKLSINYVNLTGSSLVHVDVSSSLQTQLTGINSALQALQDSDTSQATLNSEFTTDINALQTDKQNVIDNTNKISSSYVSYNASDVNTELGSINTSLGLKAPLADPTFTGTVSGVTKAMVGLSNVDNTSDLSKGISTLTQSALDLKAPLADPTFTGTVSGVTKAMVGLSNVDNTSDANKPVSTAQLTALNAKLNISGGTTSGRVNTAGISEIMTGVAYTSAGSFFYCSYDTRNVFYSTSNATANFQFILNNLPATDTYKQHTASLIYKGDFLPTSVQLRTANVDYATITPTWVNGVTPIASNSSTKIFNVTIIYCFGTYQALCSLVQFY